MLSIYDAWIAPLALSSDSAKPQDQDVLGQEASH